MCFNRPFFGFKIVFFVFGIFSFQNKSLGFQIKVLSKVENEIITDRDVRYHFFLENPTLYKSGASVEASGFQNTWDRLVTQAMVLEEHKILGVAPVKDEDVIRSLNTIRQKMGLSWKDFVKEYDLSDEDLKREVHNMIVVEKTLEARVNSYMIGKNTKELKNRGALVEKAIGEWVAQLRARYKIKNFNLETTSSNGAK
jgi:hypothetical protein